MGTGSSYGVCTRRMGSQYYEVRNLLGHIGVMH
jgi:hypothetical protein